MDVQLKRGLLDARVLAAIDNENSYGYQIIKDMKPYLEVSKATLYALNRKKRSTRRLPRATWTYRKRRSAVSAK